MLCLFSCESDLEHESCETRLHHSCVVKQSMVQGDLFLCDISPMVAKLPKLIKTGNSELDLENAMERDGVIEVLNLMHTHPKQIDKVVRYYKSAVRNADTSDADDYFPAVTTLGKLPDDWLAGWLANRSNIPVATLGKCKAFDGEALKKMVTFELGSSWQLQLPQHCIKKDITARALDMRSAELEHRLKSADAVSHISGNGKINWGAVGAFIPEVKDEKVESVLHRFSGQRALVDASQGFTVGADWELKANWSETQAMFAKGGGKLKLADLFAKRAGPNAATIISGNSSVFNSIVERAVQCCRTMEDEHSKSVLRHKVVVDEEGFNEAVKDKLKDNFKKAREALETRKAENKNKRKTTVADAQAKSAKKQKAEADGEVVVVQEEAEKSTGSGVDVSDQSRVTEGEGDLFP